MICHRANAQKDTAIEAHTDEPTVIYLRRTPIGIALGCIAVVSVVIFLVATTLMACVLYPFIWLAIKSGLSAKRRSPFGAESGQKGMRRFSLTWRPWTHQERT